jgi:DtxR family transcriptional regulator, Mn-dependent transcriptional regulator
MASFTEENYLKTIFHLLENESESLISTNKLAEATQTKAASVTDMLKRLAEKKLVNYLKYQGVNLTEEGKKQAIKTIRRHRIWEVFLVNKLGFKWDEIHDIAEELEHINSDTLINKLDEFLEKPIYDPHGDPIPDKEGRFPARESIVLLEAKVNAPYKLVHVKEDSSAFLQHLDRHQIKIDSIIVLRNISSFDGSMELTLNDEQTISLSLDVCKNLIVSKM